MIGMNGTTLKPNPKCLGLHFQVYKGGYDSRLCQMQLKDQAYDENRRICDVFASKDGYEQSALVFTTSVLLYQVSRTYLDCTDVKQRLSCKSGVYQIKPCSSCDAFFAYCDMDTDGKAWTVFQRRKDGSVDFNENWQNYACGFGNLSGEFWLGNKRIYEIMSSATYEFRIDMIDRDNGRAYYATYESIKIGNEAENYRLKLGGYINATSTAVEALDDAQNMEFYTNDRDTANCGAYFKSGWWFSACFRSNLNGEYGSQYIIWDATKSNRLLKFSEMKIRRIG
ncbi:fibrinogen C domain-containing protein 1-like [Anneissia japonica]|uniref:fibrinogen C domain-containing protein 1-like n=1 Tax=Anneissia japonica TaxID=1529436 RepID=UPI0014254FD0|nr:fibrinogen C domain-containing protein 1-like [Anneissia japonica]